MDCVDPHPAKNCPMTCVTCTYLRRTWDEHGLRDRMPLNVIAARAVFARCLSCGSGGAQRASAAGPSLQSDRVPVCVSHSVSLFQPQYLQASKQASSFPLGASSEARPRTGRASQVTQHAERIQITSFRIYFQPGGLGEPRHPLHKPGPQLQKPVFWAAGPPERAAMARSAAKYEAWSLLLAAALLVASTAGASPAARCAHTPRQQQVTLSQHAPCGSLGGRMRVPTHVQNVATVVYASNLRSRQA